MKLTKGKALHNERGQGLVEYLILVALMGVAAIVVVRSLNQTLNAKFTQVIYALRGKQNRVKLESVHKDLYKKKDLSNFMNGAAPRDDN